MEQSTNKNESSPTCCLTVELLNELRALIVECAAATRPVDARLRFEREDYERRWELLDPLTASHLIPQVPSVYRRK